MNTKTNEKNDCEDLLSMHHRSRKGRKVELDVFFLRRGRQSFISYQYLLAIKRFRRLEYSPLVFNHRNNPQLHDISNVSCFRSLLLEKYLEEIRENPIFSETNDCLQKVKYRHSFHREDSFPSLMDIRRLLGQSSKSPRRSLLLIGNSSSPSVRLADQSAQRMFDDTSSPSIGWDGSTRFSTVDCRDDQTMQWILFEDQWHDLWTERDHDRSLLWISICQTGIVSLESIVNLFFFLSPTEF